ncbi:hypothetical protein [Xenorhabdus innexi]|uniref:Uncharacterized protein n=1 Tax=Xenorhabdus innexi TaxID=290109 RepID=A0A1N6MQQ5_9GAMM|nr:hypothetical protein [Xenorhabdus innexi]PHM35602.1 hypothetical protein Xinn_02290 [Xenorhabdus innexi]SIP71173.1 conserved hypothetical protein [Xenorhabdus innexi]
MINSFSEEVNHKSLRLNIDTPFLVVPPSYDPESGTIFTKVTARVRNIYGEPLKGKKILVTNNYSSSLKDVKIFHSDHINEIKVESINNGQEGFHIETDTDGKISFIIQPTSYTELILSLYSQIPGITGTIVPADDRIYIVNQLVENLPPGMPALDILNLSGGYLKSGGESTFSAKLEHNHNIKNNGFMLFFVNNKYVKKSIEFYNPDDLETPFNLPCSIFKSNDFSSFLYVVISESGNIYPYKSESLNLTYIREPNKPWSDVDRTYDSCTVYNSKGVHPGNIIDQYTFITDTDISSPNADNAGVYVVIMGTKVPDDTSKVLFGSNVELNLYTNSLSGHSKYRWNKTMPFVPDEYGGHTASLIFPIPRSLLNNQPGYPDNRYGEVYFDYQIGTDIEPDVSYGDTWFGHINTFN